jgi:hypothetical protein
MSNQVAVPADLANIAAALQQSSTQAGAAGSGELYAKMTKFGEFVYGAENTEFEEDSLWAINPNGFQHGFVAWGTEAHGTAGTNVGEVMVSATQPMPSDADLPEVKGNWGKSVGIQMRCTNGEDEGLQALFKTNSLGGRKAYASILQEVVARITSGHADCVPLVTCTADHYIHGTYGKIFNPIFTVTGWSDMEGKQAAEPAAAIEKDAEPEPEPEAKPTRRRRKKA